MSVPVAILPVMETSHGAMPADQLSQIPVVTDADVLARVGAIIDPDARRERSLWLFFFYPDGTQAPVVVPLDDMPEMPDEDDAEVAFHLLRHFYGLDDGGNDLSFVLVICRDGTLERTDSDRQWLRMLQWGITQYATPVRLICLATPQGAAVLS